MLASNIFELDSSDSGHRDEHPATAPAGLAGYTEGMLLGWQNGQLACGANVTQDPAAFTLDTSETATRPQNTLATLGLGQTYRLDIYYYIEGTDPIAPTISIKIRAPCTWRSLRRWMVRRNGTHHARRPSPIANGAQTQAAAPTDTDLRRKLTTTMVLVLFALVAIAMATFAWFSIADSAKTRMLMIELTPTVRCALTWTSTPRSTNTSTAWASTRSRRASPAKRAWTLTHPSSSP